MKSTKIQSSAPLINEAASNGDDAKTEEDGVCSMAAEVLLKCQPFYGEDHEDSPLREEEKTQRRLGRKEGNDASQLEDLQNSEKRRSKRLRKRRIAMMKSSRRKRRQAAAKRRKMLRNAAQLKSVKFQMADTEADETETRKSRTRIRSSPSMRMRMRMQASSKWKAQLRRAAPVKSEEGPTLATCPSQMSWIQNKAEFIELIKERIKQIEEKVEAETVDEQPPATCPTPISWSHNKAELIELIKERIKQIEQKVDAENDILLSVRTSNDMAKDLLEDLEKRMEKYISKKVMDDTNINKMKASVIGGYSTTMVQEYQPTEFEKDDQRAEATAAVEVLQQYLRDQLQDELNLKKKQHNPQQLHKDIRKQEIQLQTDLIQNTADPQERGDLRCEANNAQVLENARAMWQQMNPVHGRSRTFLPSLPTISSRPTYPSLASYPAGKAEKMQTRKHHRTSPPQDPANTKTAEEIVKTDAFIFNMDSQSHPSNSSQPSNTSPWKRPSLQSDISDQSQSSRIPEGWTHWTHANTILSHQEQDPTSSPTPTSSPSHHNTSYLSRPSPQTPTPTQTHTLYPSRHDKQMPPQEQVYRPTIDILVKTGSENTTSTMTVDAERHFEALKIPKKYLWSTENLRIVESHQFHLSFKNQKEQQAFFKQVKFQQMGVTMQKLPQVTPEEMKGYEKQFQPLDTLATGSANGNQNSMIVHAEMHPPPKEPEANSEHLPGSSQYGDAYRMAMADSLLAAYPNYELKIGENIFFTHPTPGDKLCSIHSGITSLLNLQSIKNAASLRLGPIGKALSKFMKSNEETEKHAQVELLADLCGIDQQMNPDGHDAAVFVETLLEKLLSEGQEANVFSQNVEVHSTCTSCKGKRKSTRNEVMNMKCNRNIVDDQTIMGECRMEQDCGDGEISETKLLNKPDAFLQKIACRSDSTTYKERVKVPNQLIMNGAEYELKFCLVHLGNSPVAGHFVTLLTNPLDREESVIVDNGKVSRLKQGDFETFSKQAYIVGYERVQLQTMPMPSPRDIFTKMKQGMQQRIRKDNAMKKQDFMKGVSEPGCMQQCRSAIDRSNRPKEAKNALYAMLFNRMYTSNNGPLLREEEDANVLGMDLVNQFRNYKPLNWSFWKKIRFAGGSYNSKITRDIHRIEEEADKYKRKEREDRIEELVSNCTGKVLGTGNRFLENASKCQIQNEELFCEHCETQDIALLFECNHCKTILCKTDMGTHIANSKCTIHREINIGFWHTPRRLGEGEWSSKNMKLSIIRPSTSGNTTQYILEETDRERLSMVIRTSSPTQFTADHNNQKGIETPAGKRWPGHGYSGAGFVVVNEEVCYKGVDGIEVSGTFPIWRLYAKRYSVKEAQVQKGAVNLDLDRHPAKNQANLQFEEEMEFIQVASDKSKDFRMIVRRPGKKDEELTFVKHFKGNEEKPEVDNNILQKMANNQINLKNWLTKTHLEYEQFFTDVSKPNDPYRFKNEGENLCWVNAPTNTLISILPDIKRDLIEVMKQDSIYVYSGARDLPKLLLETLANSSQPQKLSNLRNLVWPGQEGKPGPALEFFRKTVEILNQQAPQSAKVLSYEKNVSHSRKPCLRRGCDGFYKPMDRTSEDDVLQFEHDEQKDGRSAQNCIDRKKPRDRTCTYGHEHKMCVNETYTKVPEIFLMTAYGGTLDQETSMEVKFQGKTYRAVNVIHHVRGNPGHHWCSSKNRATNEWQQIDDYNYGGTNWKKSYHFDKKQNAFKVGSNKLFDNLGVVFYKLQEEDSDQEMNSEAEEDMETEENDTDTRANFHTATESGQQLLRATNTHQTCFVNGCMSALLANPHIHKILRECAGEDATVVERYLQQLCHTSNIVEDTEQWKQLVVKESSWKFNLLEHFKAPTQQDAMEFFQGLIQTLCDIEDEVDDEGRLVHKAPMSFKNRQALRNIVGHTTVTTTTCTEPGCKKSHKERKGDIVVSLDISDKSKETVNSLLTAQLEKKVSNYDKDYNCDTCHTPNAGYRAQNSVSEPKPVFVVQLNRFDKSLNKNNRTVLVDEVLTEGALAGYRLTSAILHSGDSIAQGHYTTVHRDMVSKKWFMTNDERCNELTPQAARDVMKNQGYILFYSSPAELPPPLKTGKKPTRGPNRTVPMQRRFTSAREQISNFKTNDGPTTANIPKMPHTSNLKTIQVPTPSELEIATMMERNRSKTPEEIIDPDNHLVDLLNQRFGHNNFRSAEQLAAIRHILAGGKDALVIMPTGLFFPLIIFRLHLLFQEVASLSSTISQHWLETS